MLDKIASGKERLEATSGKIAQWELKASEETFELQKRNQEQS